MRRQFDSQGATARIRYFEPLAGRVEYAPPDPAVLRDRTLGLRACVRRGHRLLACRDRRDRRQPLEADLRQYHRGSGAPRCAAGSYLGYLLQPARSGYVGRNAADRTARAAQADRTVERHLAQPRTLRPREGSLRETRPRPLERGQETARGYLPELRTQRCRPVRRGQGALPQVFVRVVGRNAPIRPECPGCDQCLLDQHHRSEGRGRTAGLREGGHGRRCQGAR